MTVTYIGMVTSETMENQISNLYIFETSKDGPNSLPNFKIVASTVCEERGILSISPPPLVEGASPKYLLTGRNKEGSGKQRGLQ